MIQRRKLMLLLILLVWIGDSVAWADLLNVPGNPGGSYTDYGTLKVLTYNAFQRVFPAPEHNDECRARELGRFLRNSDYNVVILQETFDSEALEALGEELDVGPNTLSFRNIQHRPDESDLESDGGLSVLSNLAIHAPINYATGEPASGLFSRPSGERSTAPWSELIFRDCDGTDCFANKGAIWFQVNVGSVGRVNIVAMHTDAGLDTDDIQARQAQFRAVADWINTNKVLGQPFFIAGDLNVDDTFTGASSIFDNQTGCSVCNPDRPAGQRGQRGGMLNTLKGYNNAQPTSLYQRYVNNQDLTYDRATNNFAIAPSTFRDWDDADYRARFDHLLYYPNNDNLLVGPDAASDIEIVRFANNNCSEDNLDISLWPPRLISSRTMIHLSDHYGIGARIKFWKYQAPPQASMAPAMPSVPEPNYYTYGPPNYRTQNGVTQDDMNYTGIYRIFSTLSSDRVGGGFPWELRIEEEQQIGSSWVFTQSWRNASGSVNYGATVPASHDPNAISKPMGPTNRYFRYRAQACNPNGCSNWTGYSNAIRIWYTHAPYSGPIVSPEEERGPFGNTVNLSWAAVNGATASTNYVIYSSSSFDPTGAKALIYQGTDRNFSHTLVAPGYHKFWSKACDLENGKLINCSPVKVLPPFPVTTTDPPDAPKERIPHLAIFSVGGNIKISWAKLADVDEYRIEEARNSSFTDTLVTYRVTPAASGWQESILVKKTPKSGNYFYRALACNKGVCQYGYTINRTPISTNP